MSQDIELSNVFGICMKCGFFILENTNGTEHEFMFGHLSPYNGNDNWFFRLFHGDHQDWECIDV